MGTCILALGGGVRGFKLGLRFKGFGVSGFRVHGLRASGFGDLRARRNAGCLKGAPRRLTRLRS